MGVDPIRYASAFEDFSQRFLGSTVVVASPALAAETVVAQVTVAELEAILSGVFLQAWVAFTVGTTGNSVRLRLRRGGLAGTLIADSGALTGGVAAAGLLALAIQGIDIAPVLPNQLYSLTLQVGAATAASAVSAVSLQAQAI